MKKILANRNLFIQNGEWVTIFSKKEKGFFYGLRLKLILAYLFISVVPLLFFANVSTQTLDGYFADASKKKYLYEANLLALTISKQGFLYDDSLKTVFDSVLSNQTYRILVLDRKGIVINDSNKEEIGNTYISPEIIDALQRNDSANIYKDTQTIQASASIVKQKVSENTTDLSNSNVVASNSEESDYIDGAVLVVASVADDAELLDNLGSIVLNISIMLGIIVIVLVIFTSKIMIDPVKSFLSVVKRISDGKFDKRVVIKGNDEFTELGKAFNQMSEKLEQVDNNREEFVSNVSHELKTPLSSMKVLSESILFEENVPIEMYREFLQDINSEIDRMTNIINDLLNVVKLGQGELGLNIKEADFNKMIEEIIKRLDPLATQKNIDLKYESNKNITGEIDETKLMLAISNLIENAIKYTDDGGNVKVSLAVDHQNAFITIQDDGIGINEEEQLKVFTRFYRIDKTRDRQTGGTGLGLAITHDTVLLHNGSIKLYSKEDEGSTFVVRIPLQRSKS